MFIEAKKIICTCVHGLSSPDLVLQFGGSNRQNEIWGRDQDDSSCAGCARVHGQDNSSDAGIRKALKILRLPCQVSNSKGLKKEN